MLGFIIPVVDISVNTHYRPIPAIYDSLPVAEGCPLPCFGGSGTGGFEGVDFFTTARPGYTLFTVLHDANTVERQADAPYAAFMHEVKVGFGRTLSHLPAVFGVSRQTLYNWLNGETPKQQHQDKLVQLAAAARVFTETDFKPTALSLERSLAQGKSFIELIAQGADGKEAAEKLVRIMKRGAAARDKLDALLGARIAARPSMADMGRPALEEDT